MLPQWDMVSTSLKFAPSLNCRNLAACCSTMLHPRTENITRYTVEYK